MNYNFLTKGQNRTVWWRIEINPFKVPRNRQSESDFMPYHFSISTTCGFAFEEQERVFMWSILHIRHLCICRNFHANNYDSSKVRRGDFASP